MDMLWLICHRNGRTSEMDMQVGVSHEGDRQISQELAALAENRPFEEVAQAFPGYVRRQLLTRFLAYYELFKMIQDVPGWIAECGIYRGFSLFALARFLEIFCMGDKTRKIIGFDNFAGFTDLSEHDGNPEPRCTRHQGGSSPAEFKDDFYRLLELANRDCFAPWSKRIEVVEGNIQDTVPKYCQDNPGLRLSMLNIDVDIYDPVRTALSTLYPRLLPGGIVVLDEFAHIDWPGESRAVEDVFKENNWKVPKLKTLSFTGTPTTYFVKDEW